MLYSLCKDHGCLIVTLLKKVFDCAQKCVQPGKAAPGKGCLLLGLDLGNNMTCLCSESQGSELQFPKLLGPFKGIRGKVLGQLVFSLIKGF